MSQLFKSAKNIQGNQFMTYAIYENLSSMKFPQLNKFLNNFHIPQFLW
jgi:hypothetical protein